MDISETELAALVAEGEAFVIDAEEVEESGVEVVNMDGVFGDGVAEFVALSVNVTGFGAAAGHPHGVGFLVVITADFGAGTSVTAGALGHGSAAEFGIPDDEGVIEEAAFLKVFEERCDGSVDLFGFIGQGIEDAAVMVPALVEELDKADAAFDESAGEEAVVGEARLAGLGAIHFVNALWFGLDVHELRDAGLHAKGHFVLADAGGDFGVADVVEVNLVEVLDGIDDEFAFGAGDSLGIGEKVDGIAL
jgi:hypothetical protein